QLDTESTILAELASTTLLTNGTNNETLWSRLKTLAMNFVDGVLTVVEVVADTFTAQKVDTNVLCVGDTCVDEATLKALLQGSSQTPVQNTQRSGGSVDTTVPDTTSTPTTTPQTSSSTPLDLTNPPDPTSDGASTTPAISEVLPEPPVEETTSPPIEQTEPTDPTPSKDTNPPDTAPDVAILPATPEPTNEPITP
ncbi:MAG: hypothetical protein K9M10_01880, partial [Candidatus Pacebacteria bacterium]|nr:hypothetical protein [Candidatus Paceibacterota bacterium]MCF7857213.1 hypothetical protein [Candidatus Paceibacterota bacterium]